MAQIITLDASVIIALHSPKDQHHAWAVELFTNLIDFDWSISALTYAEVLVHPIRAGVLDQFQLSLRNLNITVSGISPDEASELAQTRVRTGLKMPDAVVIHRALKAKSRIATSDQGLAKAALELGIEVFHPGSKVA